MNEITPHSNEITTNTKWAIAGICALVILLGGQVAYGVAEQRADEAARVEQVRAADRMRGAEADRVEWLKAHKNDPPIYVPPRPKSTNELILDELEKQTEIMRRQQPFGSFH